MDVMSIVSSLMAMQMANTQQQIATRVLKSNLDWQAQVLQLLEPAAPAANNAPGIGGNLDISA